MKRVLCLSILLNSLLVFSQEKIVEITLSDGLKVIDFRFHQNGAFSVFKQGKKEKTSVYTLVDENVEPITYISAEKMKVPNERMNNAFTAGTNRNGSSILSMYFSPTGKNILYKNSGNYFLWNANEVEFTDKDINGDIEEDPNVKITDIDASRDFLSKQFMTDTHFISIGRKEGLSNFNKGYYANMDIFLYRKNLETSKEDYLKLQLPKDCCFFTVIDPKLLYFDEDIFILSYALRENGETNKKLKSFRPKPEEQTKKYRVVTYNFKAEVIADRTIEVTRPEGSDAFGITNLGDNSFHFLQTAGAKQFQSSTEVIPATESMAQLSYSKEEDAFYAHSVLKLEEKDDAFMLQKFDTTGKLLWNTYQELPGFNLKHTNMRYMRLLVDVTKNFVGVSLYSYSSQDHNKFYVLDKNTGEIMAQKEFGRHDNKRVLRFLKTKTNSYSAMILKDEFSEKLTLDKNSFLASLYDTDYKEFVKELSVSDERYSLLSHFTENGIITVAKQESNEKLQFYKFSLEKSPTKRG